MFGLRGLRPDLEITGFETAFSIIAPQLVERGHRVTIYARRAAHTPARRIARESGVDLMYMPSPGGKNLSALTSTTFALSHALARRDFDVWFFVNVGMGHHCALAALETSGSHERRWPRLATRQMGTTRAGVFSVSGFLGGPLVYDPHHGRRGDARLLS